jgi:hypothetical protein
MGEVVNLNKFQKANAKRRQEIAAAENRARFGRTKEAKSKTLKDADKAKSDLDGKRLD